MADRDDNKLRLQKLVRERKKAGKAYARRSYLQGRIDEFCAQNAIVQADYPSLDLRLGGI